MSLKEPDSLGHCTVRQAGPKVGPGQQSKYVYADRWFHTYSLYNIVSL